MSSIENSYNFDLKHAFIFNFPALEPTITILGIIVDGPASQRAQGVVNSSRGEEDSKPELLNYGGRTRVIVLCWCVNKRKSQKAGKRRRHSEKWGKIL